MSWAMLPPDPVDELPDTGAGMTASPAPGAWVPVLLTGALLLTLAGSRLRARGQEEVIRLAIPPAHMSIKSTPASMIWPGCSVTCHGEWRFAAPRMKRAGHPEAPTRES